MKVKSFSRVRLLATPWTAAHKAPPSMGFSRQEYWSGLPLPSPTEPLDDLIYICGYFKTYVVFPGGSEGKASDCNAGDLGLIPGSEGSPGKGSGNPLQYFCLENPMDRGAWRATVHEVGKELDPS